MYDNKQPKLKVTWLPGAQGGRVTCTDTFEIISCLGTLKVFID